ncbi:MAG: N utilization substance protein B [Pirellulaceae bacterium]|nr:MAG: N utilization substance protein B [Pirellulaceae bacterium]
MTTRRRAREVALQLLYADDLNPDHDEEVAEKFLRGRLHGNRNLVAFAHRLWRGVVENRERLDREIAAHAANWSIRRMAAIDRNIIRLAAYEILESQTPGTVAISEAIELAKRYGNRHSSQFVNGILDRIWKHHQQHGGVQEGRSELVEETNPSPCDSSQISTS